MSVVAILEPTSLIGSEIRQALNHRHDLWREMRLLTLREDEAGTLSEVAGGAAIVSMFEEDGLEGVDVAFFCGSLEEMRPLLEQRPPAMTAILLSPGASPDDGVPVVSAVNLDQARRSETLLSPHPAAVLLSHLLHPLREFGVRRAVATFLEPVSTAEKEGIDELFEQTRAVLGFTPDPPREVFPIQMAFNVVPSDAAHHVAELVTAVVDPEIEVDAQILRCGVFHSYGASVHLSLDNDPGEEAVKEALAAHPLIDPAPDPELLGMADAANRDEVLLGAVEAVARRSGGRRSGGRRPGEYRVWAVMDNLTCGAALNAIHILEAVSGAVVAN
jgi:aspartate-semialdehyde dehydrogenase